MGATKEFTPRKNRLLESLCRNNKWCKQQKKKNGRSRKEKSMTQSWLDKRKRERY